MLATFRFDALKFGERVESKSLELGVRAISFFAPFRTLSHSEFNATINQLRRQGFQLEESEWHHSSFRPGPEPASVVDFVLHVLHRRDKSDIRKDARLIVRGKLEVVWKKGETKTPIAKSITVQDLVLLTRAGAPVFQRAFTYERRAHDVASAHPIILHDLDKNGSPEIVIPRWNRVYRNEGGGKFREQPLFEAPTPLAEAGIVADFNDDGWADLMSVNKHGELVFSAGSGLTFAEPKVVSDSKMPSALAMTAGDIDCDGDLDLWVSQYKPAYLDGQMPTPYYDANDGEPARLLVNNGSCQFEDQTELAGLGKNRNRRTYSSSFVDFDGDQDLDLVVVSDYAGVDLYQNDGQGKFTDVTPQLGNNRHLFGMAHTFSDYDGDGKLDLYAIGMSSTTARRLDSLKLTRQDRADVAQMRSAMGFGNRRLHLEG